MSSKRRWAIALLTPALMLLPAAAASAEPDPSATLDAANPKFTWEGAGPVWATRPAR